MPLIGKGASRCELRPPTMRGTRRATREGSRLLRSSLPFTGNGGNVTGMLPARTSCPSEDSDSRNVSTPIDVERIGSLLPGCGRMALHEVEDAMAARIHAGQERRPGRPRMIGQRAPENAADARLDHLSDVRENAAFDEVVHDVPVRAVPADDEEAIRHADDRSFGGATSWRGFIPRQLLPTSIRIDGVGPRAA